MRSVSMSAITFLLAHCIINTIMMLLQMYELVTSNVSGSSTVQHDCCTCRGVRSFTANSHSLMMPRGILTRCPSANHLLAIGGDQESKAVCHWLGIWDYVTLGQSNNWCSLLQLHVWDAHSGSLKQRIACMEGVCDICSFDIGSNSYLAALTEHSVRLHKWT